MKERDEIAAVNRRHWEWSVRKKAGCTVPWLNLNADLLRRYARGDLENVPDGLDEIYPAGILTDVEGKDVLCLASGGGQQSVVFGLLGARVTVLDLTEGQLEGDRKAAAHYGFEITTLQGDMRDLSPLADESFDLVYQGNSMAWIPDVREVYVGVARVLRPGGVYRVDFANPATEFVEWDSWNGEAYPITVPYSEKAGQSDVEGDENCFQFRHYMVDIFNGLLDARFSIQQVQDSPLYFKKEKTKPGSWEHWLKYVGGFAVVAKKE